MPPISQMESATLTSTFPVAAASKARAPAQPPERMHLACGALLALPQTLNRLAERDKGRKSRPAARSQDESLVAHHLHGATRMTGDQNGQAADLRVHAVGGFPPCSVTSREVIVVARMGTSVTAGRRAPARAR